MQLRVLSREALLIITIVRVLAHRPVSQILAKVLHSIQLLAERIGMLVDRPLAVHKEVCRSQIHNKRLAISLLMQFQAVSHQTLSIVTIIEQVLFHLPAKPILCNK